MSHCDHSNRREYDDAYKAGEAEAARYLLPIRELYEIGRGLPDRTGLRVRQRRRMSLLVLRRIEMLLDKEFGRYLAKSGMANAVDYARNQWSRLIAYVGYGRACIDNNLTEKALRPCKLGAKSWLFVGSPETGETSAVIYTILES